MRTPWNVVRPARGRWRWPHALFAAALGATVALQGVTSAAAAPPETKKLERQQYESVREAAAQAAPKSEPSTAPARKTAVPVWPAAGVAEVAVSPASRRAGALPVSISPAVSGGADPAARSRANAPTKVRVELMSRERAQAKGVNGLLIRLDRADGGTADAAVNVRVDYGKVRGAFGGDWVSRLRLVQVPECTGCAATELPSRIDTATESVVADVPLSKAGGFVALAAGPSGGTGSFSASPLAPASTWSHGGSSGGFNWSYPMRTPPSVGGPQAAVALSYSSQSVDGKHAASNNQPSWVGEGFEYAPGYIERRYRACAEDMEGDNNNTEKTGDLCWAADNATLSFGGSSVELLKDGNGRWHPVREDGSKIERLAGMTANGDDNGEYWKVTTGDGNQYFYGKHQLDGWTTGKPVTNSVSTVPVYGNHPGEECHQSTFAASDCGGKQQGWRWNLDYVIDVHGNTMSLWYSQEANYYARNKKTATPVSYDRASLLSRMDYGTNNRSGTDSVFSATPAPARVELTPADRCVTTSCGTKNETNWPDTPYDQECFDKVNCLNASPTFWSTQRLRVVTTKVWKNGAYKPVDSWTLRQSFPDPGDGSRAGLWLDGITHKGHNVRATTPPELPVPEVTLPEVKFEGAQMSNRVDSDQGDWALAMNWRRITRITNELGGELFVTYSSKECARGGTMPAAPDNNKVRCYPVRWTPPTYTDPITDYFHKYVVTEVQQIDKTGTGKTIRTRYEYPPKNIPLWHYDNEDGVTPAKQLTWGQWRGYPVVITRVGEGAEEMKSETLYFRGMHGDKLGDGGTRTINVTGTEGGSVPDYDTYAGLPREQIQYLGSSVLTSTISTPWRSDPPSATRSGTPRAEARYVRTATVNTREAIAGGTWRRTSTHTTFDGYGLPTKVEDRGSDSSTTDETCVETEYARNTTNPYWLLNTVKRIHGWADDCATPPTTQAQITSDTRFTLDGLAYGAEPKTGKVTRTEEIASFSGGIRTYYDAGTATYDKQGRLTFTTDIAGEVSETRYTPTEGGPLTQIQTINPLGWTTTNTIDPAFGLPTMQVDVNNRPTEITYDAIGRTRGMWPPGRAKSAFPNDPAVEYAYQVSTSQPSATTTRAVNAEGSSSYSYDIVDSWGRPTQTQTRAYGDGRVVTDTIYDTAGRGYLSYGPYYNSGTAGTTHFRAEALDVPRQTRLLFDAAGRTTDTIALGKDGAGTIVELWRSHVSYLGDRIATTPPAGGTATTVWTDAKGRTETVWHHHGGTPTGGYDETRYSYYPTGGLATIRDASTNEWSYTYDIRGLTTSVKDPDKGTMTMSYNSILQLEKTTDSRPAVADLAYTYDRLGRPTTVRENSITGPKRAEWTYDSPAKGLTAKSSRWIGANEYKTELLAVDPVYRPTTTTVTIPPNEGNLAGSYTSKVTYNPDGSVATRTLPAVPRAGLAEERLTVGYDDTEFTPDELKTNFPGITHYVNDSVYTNLNELNLVTRSTALTGAGWVQSGQYYDPSTGRLAKRPVLRSVAPAYLANASYAFQDAGNVEKIDDDPGRGAALRDTQCFDYDHQGRLTQAWTPASNECGTAPTVAGLGGPAKYWQGWSFGAPTHAEGRVGNRLSQTEYGTPTGTITTSYSYPDAGSDQPHRLDGATIADNTGTRPVSYAYDEVGNTKSRPGPAGQQTLTWDPEGSLATLADTTGTSSYVYDADGNRLISKDPGGATLHLGETEIRVTSPGGAVSATRYYSFNGETIAQRTSTGALTWLAGDHQGTGQISVTADAAQTVTQRRTTPYGAIRGPTTTWPNKRGFVDGYQDPTGLTHLGAREYDPQAGRFISVDPLFDHGDPHSFNAYTYSANNPVTYSDPSGQSYCIQPGDCPHGSPSTPLAAEMLNEAIFGKDCCDSKPYIPSTSDIIVDLVFNIGVGVTPAGVIIDVVDAGKCVADISWSCALTSGAGFIPIAGDALKYGKRGAKSLDEAAAAGRAADDALAASQKAIDDLAARAGTAAEKRADVAGDIKVKLANSAAMRAAGDPPSVKKGGGSGSGKPSGPPPSRFVADSKGATDDLVGTHLNVVSLGKSPDYWKDATAVGAVNYRMEDADWNAMTARTDGFGGFGDSSEVWVRNQRFLDKHIRRGAMFRLVTDPLDKTLRPDGFFKREINHLTSKGYTMTPDRKFMLPPT